MTTDIDAQIRGRVDSIDHEIRTQAAKAARVFNRKNHGRDRCVYWELEPGDATSYKMLIAYHGDGRGRLYRGWVTMLSITRHPVTAELPGYVIDGGHWSPADVQWALFTANGYTDNQYTAEVVARFVSYLNNPELRGDA